MPTSSRFPIGNATAVGTWTNGTTGLNADDGTNATFTTTTKNDVRSLTVGGFGFDAIIPDGSRINSVAIEVQEQVTSGGTLRTVIRRAGVDGASNDNTTDTTLTVRTYSNLARPSGGSWTKTDLLDGTLTARFEGRQPNNTTSRTYQADYLKVIVDYTPQAAGALSLSSASSVATAGHGGGFGQLAVAHASSVATAGTGRGHGVVSVAAASSVAVSGTASTAGAVGSLSLTAASSVASAGRADGFGAVAAVAVSSVAAAGSGGGYGASAVTAAGSVSTVGSGSGFASAALSAASTASVAGFAGAFGTLSVSAASSVAVSGTASAPAAGSSVSVTATATVGVAGSGGGFGSSTVGHTAGAIVTATSCGYGQVAVTAATSVAVVIGPPVFADPTTGYLVPVEGGYGHLSGPFTGRVARRWV